MAEPPAAETERLYALPLEDFVRERDELAKRLREDDDRDAAAAVKALKKPSVAAWPEDVRRAEREVDEARKQLEAAERRLRELG